jgi:hypothetical protein
MAPAPKTAAAPPASSTSGVGTRLLLPLLLALAFGARGARAEPPAAADSRLDIERPAPTATSHRLAVKLAEMGDFSCASRANQVASFLSPGDGGFVFLPPMASPAGQRQIHSDLIVQVGPAHYALAGIELAPNQANGCEAVYHTVTYHPKTCDDVMRKNFPGVEFVSIAETGIQLGSIAGSAWAYTMTAGPSGCVAIKGERVQ